MSQLLVGLQKYVDIRQLLIQGAEKEYENAQKKYRQFRSIEQLYEQQDKVADFFEIVYEKFEKEIDNFFDERIGDVQEANSFYKLKTKFLDRKLKGLQSLVVKQNFEIENSKSFYKQEVSILQSEITEIKKDFSQNLADVKSSMILCGFEDEIDAVNNNSVPDVEMMEGMDPDMNGN